MLNKEGMKTISKLYQVVKENEMNTMNQGTVHNSEASMSIIENKLTYNDFGYTGDLHLSEALLVAIQELDKFISGQKITGINTTLDIREVITNIMRCFYSNTELHTLDYCFLLRAFKKRLIKLNQDNSFLEFYSDLIASHPNSKEIILTLVKLENK